jgi:hypothetical protein
MTARIKFGRIFRAVRKQISGAPERNGNYRHGGSRQLLHHKPGLCSFQASGKRDQLKIKHLLTIRSPNRDRPLEDSLAQMRSKQMLGKSDLVDNLSCDLSRARNKRDALASDLITLTAEIAVLEASLLMEKDRRKPFKESQARRKANDEECIRVFRAAGYKVVEPRFNVLTYKKWLEKGRRVKKVRKAFRSVHSSCSMRIKPKPVGLPTCRCRSSA